MTNVLLDQNYVYKLGYMYVGYAPMDDTVLKAQEKKLLEECMPHLEKVLSKQKYLAGDALTIADFSFLGTYTFVTGNKALRDALKEGKFPSFQAYIERLIAEIPAAKGGAYQWFQGFCLEKGEQD